jgi:hypothetical protein
VHRFFLHISSFSQRWHLFFAPNILWSLSGKAA